MAAHRFIFHQETMGLPMTRLQSYSRHAVTICRLLSWLMPAGVIFFWLTTQTQYDYPFFSFVFQYGEQVSSITQTDLGITTRFLAMVVSLGYLSILVFALRYLTSLFRNYQNGDVFVEENATLYRKLGYSIFYWVFGGIVYHAIITLVLSFNNPPGERLLELTIPLGFDVLTLGVGVVVVMISWVMQEAYKVSSENGLTI